MFATLAASMVKQRLVDPLKPFVRRLNRCRFGELRESQT
jgi:hypothetical protein